MLLAVLVMNGSQDGLFAPDGVKAGSEKIAACFAKAGVPERQRAVALSTCPTS